MPEQYDRIIRNGSIYDGSGAPPIEAALGIRGNTIATVGAIPEDAEGGEIIDATGHAVCPGFIDVHSHDDTLVFTEPEMFGKSMQGITTVINGTAAPASSPAPSDARSPATRASRTGTTMPATSPPSRPTRRR